LCTVTEANVGKKMIWTALTLNMHYNTGCYYVLSPTRNEKATEIEDF